MARRASARKHWLGWPSFSAKDWITTGLSVGAILISLISAYFSVVRVKDDVRLVVTEFPQLFIESPEELSLGDQFSLAFINAGSRSAIILGFWLFVQQPTTNTKIC